jgi:DNA polymerase-1
MSESYVVLDYETFGIGARPEFYPPKPVGVALRWPDGKKEYLAWGHPYGDNNCTLEEATRAVARAFQQHTVIFHNAKFDMEVAWQHMGIPFPRRWHDTLLLAYLHSPDEHTFALKPLSEKFLRMPPEERDEVREWILANIKEAKKSTWGAFIAFAPVALVGPYAIGDVDRTWRLFNFMAQEVFDTMPAPYNRERRLLPHLVAAERRGIRVDRELLKSWEVTLTGALHHCDQQIKAKLNAPELEIDSDKDLAFALDRENLMTHWETPDGVPFAAVAKEMPLTVAQPFGGGEAVVVVEEKLTRSVSKDALARCCTDKDLVQQLAYRNAAATMLRVFVKPWLEKSEKDGRLHTEWHQVRGTDKNGTRTGRIASANPNLANVPNPNETPPPFGLTPLPSMREALLPEEGCLWISADYSQQELRITAHYENGLMKDAYIADPSRDLHAYAQELIKTRVGKIVSRKHVKNVAFASIYGAGIPKLARMMGVSDTEAEEIRDAYFDALPGLKKLIRAVAKRTTEQKYVPSLGGRRLSVEPPVVDKGRLRSFDYKQTNKLIQGSAADMTKESIALYCESGGSNYFLSQVYDEINISVPYDRVEEQAALLRACMINAIPLSVPMLVDIEVGPNWHDLTPLELP